jgi:hypothetical protein
VAETLPRVIGLAELLGLSKSIREKPAPLVYFTDREFRLMIKGVVELNRAPRGLVDMPTFLPWPGGGVVAASCSSPPGQICVGPWTPAGPGHGSGVFMGCRCRQVNEPLPVPNRACEILLDADGRLNCVGDCGKSGKSCKLGYWRDPKTGIYTMQCRCERMLKANTP